MSAARTKRLFETLYAAAPRPIQRNYLLWREAVSVIDAAPFNLKLRTTRKFARRLGVRVSTVYGRRSEFRKRGPIALLDKRFSAPFWNGRHHVALSAPAIAFLRKLAGQLEPQAAIRAFQARLLRWQNGDASAKVPGWPQAPQGNPPPGCSSRNLARHLRGLPRPSNTIAVFEIAVRVNRNNHVVINAKRKNAPCRQ